MEKILLGIVLFVINLNCYSSETLQEKYNIEELNANNNATFILYQSEPEVLPFINNHNFVIQKLSLYNETNNIIKQLQNIKNSVITITDSNKKSNTAKNYSTIYKFNYYKNILNNLNNRNIIPKSLMKEIIFNTNNAIKNTVSKLILLDTLEI